MSGGRAPLTYTIHVEGTAMAKVYGIHTIELAPGVSETELAEFVIKEVSPSIRINLSSSGKMLSCR